MVSAFAVGLRREQSMATRRRRPAPRGRGMHDRHGYDRHNPRGHSGHSGAKGWLVWVVIIAAVVMWGKGNQGVNSTPSEPRKGNTSTVCTEYFKGGC